MDLQQQLTDKSMHKMKEAGRRNAAVYSQPFYWHFIMKQKTNSEMCEKTFWLIEIEMDELGKDF